MHLNEGVLEHINQGDNGNAVPVVNRIIRYGVGESSSDHIMNPDEVSLEASSATGPNVRHQRTRSNNESANPTVGQCPIADVPPVQRDPAMNLRHQHVAGSMESRSQNHQVVRQDLQGRRFVMPENRARNAEDRVHDAGSYSNIHVRESDRVESSRQRSSDPMAEVRVC